MGVVLRRVVEVSRSIFLIQLMEIGRVINIMSGIFLQMIGDEWLGIETGWEEVKIK